MSNVVVTGCLVVVIMEGSFIVVADVTGMFVVVGDPAWYVVQCIMHNNMLVFDNEFHNKLTWINFHADQ